MFHFDIQSIIVSYFDNYVDLLSWRHTCTQTNYIFSIYFKFHKLSDIFIVTHLRLESNGSGNVTDNDMKKMVTYIDCNIDTTIKNLHTFPNLKTLKCSFNSGIVYIPPTLEKLTCGWNRNLTDDLVMKLTNLRVLKCQHNDFISFESISQLINLEHLELGYKTEVYDVTFEKLTKLKFLRCNLCILTDLTLLYLPNLEHLSCGSGSVFTDIGLSYVPKLTALDCGASTRFTNDGFKHVPNFIFLDCNSSASLTDEALIYLPNLEVLDCGSSTFTNEGLKTLKRLKILYPRYNQKISREVSKNTSVLYKHSSTYMSFYRKKKI